jgi:hypothetical protein
VIGVILAGAIGIGPAFAGEVTSNGKSTPAPAHANSECVYSRLDDPDDDGFGRTQSWGQIPKEERDFLASVGVAPWTLCNGHLNPQR